MSKKIFTYIKNWVVFHSPCRYIFKDAHKLNALSPMVSTLLGILSSESEIQLANVRVPILFNLCGSEMFSSDEHRQNVSLQSSWTLDGISIDSIDDIEKAFLQIDRSWEFLSNLIFRIFLFNSIKFSGISMTFDGIQISSNVDKKNDA